ncbi:uncharacterized protein M6B38_339180 [Iris pallida]|uniref:18S pre-ribosomal assembly protein gar2-related n=1 Tax=Iris pallida TaxID=29817 RepID=A0AAX6GYM5_IRIPA|nr:uncharacterized protein M6B38_339180 [Iris pallida]
MKLDTESPYHHTYANELASKVIVHNDNHFILPKNNCFMVDMLEIGNDSLKEGNHDVKYCNENESCKVTLPTQTHGIANMEDYTNRNKDEFCMRAPYNGPNSEIGLVVEEDFYTKKDVAKVELSEMIVCTKDGSFHRVGNILIPEEVHSFQNSLTEEEVRSKAPFTSDQSAKNDNGDVAEEMKCTTSSHDFEYEVINRDSVTTIGSNPADPTSGNKSPEKCSRVNSVEDGDELGTAEQAASSVSENGNKCLFSENGDKLDINDSVGSNNLNEISERQLPPSEELITESLQEDVSILSCRDDQNHTIDREGIDQAILEESKTTSTMVSSTVEDPGPSSGGKEILSACKVPSGVITFTLDPQETSISSTEESKDNKDIQQSKQADTDSGTEGVTLDGATTPAQCSFLRLIQEDSSFHGPGFLSSPRANSGYIAYSGSTSLRSESSTTSAQSFAFPVLQSEWNSSPVRMAKPRRRWGLFCCKF